MRCRVRALSGGVGALLFLFVSPWSLSGQSYGLDSRLPVGAFLNQKLPSARPGPTGDWKAEPAFPNLSFEDPLCLVAEPRSARRGLLIHSKCICFLRRILLVTMGICECIKTSKI